MPLECQAALETAVTNAILGLSAPGYTTGQCSRMYDGMPPPRMGNVFVSVWSDGSRKSQSRTSKDEVFGVMVTVTIRATQPLDRWLIHRDDVELRLNRITALIHRDSYNFAISNAASILAGFDGSGQPVGFREALAFAGYDAIMEKGADWFAAETTAPAGVSGFAQTARFGQSRRVQALATMG